MVLMQMSWRTIVSVAEGVNIFWTHKRCKSHECILSAVATDALGLKHQAISIHSADQIFIVLGQFHAKVLHLLWTALENEIAFWKSHPVI